MLNKYDFADITIFMRMSNDDSQYINLTEYEVGGENQILTLNANSKYIIILNSFMYNSNKKKGENNYICDIDVDDLMKLAYLSNPAILMKFKSHLGKFYDELFAILCAKRILDYRYGEIVKVGENCYSFSRLSFNQSYGKKKKVRKELFEKTFYTA